MRYYFVNWLAINTKLMSFETRPKPWRPRVPPQHYCVLKIPLRPSSIKQVLRLHGAFSPDVLHDAYLQITLTIPEVVDSDI